MHRGLAEEPGQSQLQDVVREWNASWHTSRPVLQVHDEGDRLRFVDSRPCARQSTWTMEGLEAEIYRLCDSAQTPAALMHQLSAGGAANVTTSAVESAIDSLLDTQVVLSLKGKVLALGVRPDSLAHRSS